MSGIASYFRGIGRAMAGGYDAGESDRMRMDLKWGRRTAIDEDHLVGDTTRTLIRQKGADLRRNNAVVAGACDRIALFSVGATGILPQAKTSDEGWNKAAEQFWADYSLRCDSRRRISLRQLQWIAVALRPTHGGLYLQKLDDGTVRPIECERIFDPRIPDAAKVFTEGVRVDSATGQVISYRVHSRCSDGTFSGEHAEQDVKAESMVPVIRPPWRLDQVREIPDFAPVVPALQDIHEMNTYALNTAKWQQKIVAYLKRKGGAMNSGVRGSTPVVGQRQETKFDWGILLEGFQGDGIDMVSSNSPGPQHIPYIKLQLALCAAAIGFPYEFLTLDLSGLDFSRQKGMLLLVNYACRPWKQWLVDSMLRPLWDWRIAMAMRTGGELSPAPAPNGISEWNKVEWQFPEEPWIDRQEAQQSDVLEIQAGLGTLTAASKRRGNELETVIRQKARDIKLIERIAKEEGVDPEKLSKMQIPGQTETAKPAPAKVEPMPMDGE